MTNKEGWKHDVLGSWETPDVPLQQSFTVCCACAVLMKIIVLTITEMDNQAVSKEIYA